MKRVSVWTLWMLIGAGAASSAFGGWQNLLRQTADSLHGGNQLETAEIVDGLKEALEIATTEAVRLGGRENGYYRHPDIKVRLPETIRKSETLVRAAGMGEQLDAFERSMNRAAEQAAPEARSIFLGAIRQMKFDDARRILNGRENEATLYFRDKTGAELASAFKPLIHAAMQEVGVTQHYQRLQAGTAGIPFLSEWLVDLDDYVTAQALDGLFFLVAREEAEIRRDPGARVTALLQKVFAVP